MDPIFTAGIVHIFGVLVWLEAVIMISFKLITGPGEADSGRPRKGNDQKRLALLLIMSGLWASLSGLFYQYQQIALASKFEF